MDFDFMAEDNKIEETKETESQTATGGSLSREEIKAEAKKLAGSSKGLDIEAFQRKYKIHIMHIDELLGD